MWAQAEDLRGAWPSLSFQPSWFVLHQVFSSPSPTTIPIVGVDFFPTISRKFNVFPNEKGLLEESFEQIAWFPAPCWPRHRKLWVDCVLSTQPQSLLGKKSTVLTTLRKPRDCGSSGAINKTSVSFYMGPGPFAQVIRPCLQATWMSGAEPSNLHSKKLSNDLNTWKLLKKLVGSLIAVPSL